MHVVCEHCKSRFRIADQKVRSGRPVSIKCPKCRNRIEIDSGAETSTANRRGSLEGIVNEVASSAYDASDRPFDYLEAGVRSALVCEYDLAVKQKIRNALERLNYYIVDADSGRNALKFMRFHTYNLIILNEAFEGSSIESNHVLQYLAQLPMNARRDTFTVLVGDGFRTKDRMTAFHRSVNLVINLKDLDDMEKILQGDLAEHEEFYRVFKESLRKTGRA